MKIVLYTLEYPENNIRYVGITRSDLKQRLYYHCSIKNNSNIRKNEWVQDLKESGIRPLIKEVQSYSTITEAVNDEKFYIALFKYYGFNLLNNSSGGEFHQSYTGVNIDQYTLNGEYVYTFSSSKEASRSLNKHCHKEILNCCKGKASKAQGYVWRYSSDSFNKYKVLKTNEVQSKAIIKSIGVKVDRIKDGVIIESHPSINDAVKKGYGNATTIRRVLNGTTDTTSKGFTFRYST